jgi:hypothetical protein
MLPYFVTVKGNPRAGVVHQGADGFWRANNWQGRLGAFASEDEAVAAIRASPPNPKRRHKADPPDFAERWRLTDAASGYIVRDGGGRAVGAVMPAGEGFEAWARGKLLGHHPTEAGAAAAVVRAAQTKKARR